MIANEQNRSVAHRFLEGVLNRGDLALVDEIFDPTFVDHSEPEGLPSDLEGVKAGVAAFRRAFPDLHLELADGIAADDKVVSRVIGQGTMRGELFGLPATGQSATWQEIHIARIVDGRFVEHWSLADQLGMLRQLGLTPEATRSGSST
jgi:predicted ester cyclase